MHASVAERDKADRATMLREPVPSCQASKRRDREGQREEPERPEAGLNLELFDGVRAEVVGESPARQPDEGQEADEDERNRCEAPAVRPATLARNRRRRQNDFLRSIPA
jgi:hypothetical protein